MILHHHLDYQYQLIKHHDDDQKFLAGCWLASEEFLFLVLVVKPAEVTAERTEACESDQVVSALHYHGDLIKGKYYIFVLCLSVVLCCVVILAEQTYSLACPHHASAFPVI